MAGDSQRVNFSRGSGARGEDGHPISSGRIVVSDTVRQYMGDHALTPEFAASFDCTFTQNTITFPVHNLVGGPGFKVTRNLQEGPKFVVSPVEARTGFGFYLYHRARPSIKASRMLVLVEGLADALCLHYHGLTNACAVMKSRVSATQLQLATIDTDCVIVWGDGDEGGEKLVHSCVGTSPRFIGLTVQHKDPAEFVASLSNKRLLASLIRFVALNVDRFSYIECNESGAPVLFVEREDPSEVLGFDPEDPGVF